LVVSMTCDNLENLAAIGQLKVESFSESEFEGLLKSGMARLDDAKKTDLNLESRFDLAYNSSHALSLAALRRHGYLDVDEHLVEAVIRVANEIVDRIGNFVD